MLITTNHIITILISAIANVIIGRLYYSDMIFGKEWSKITGCDKNCNCEKNCTCDKNSTEELSIKILIQFLFAILLSAALYFIIYIFCSINTALILSEKGLLKMLSFFINDLKKSCTLLTSLKTAGLVWIGFVVPTLAGETIWATENWKKYCTKIIGELIKLLIMAAIISFMSR